MEDKQGNSHTQRQSAMEVQTVRLYMQGNEAQERKMGLNYQWMKLR